MKCNYVARLLIVIGLVLGAGCGNSDLDSGEDSPNSSLEEKVIVYSPHGREILQEFKDLFESAHPETTVEFLYISSQQCLERIRNEKANPLADVWWGAGHTSFMIAAREGILESYTPSWASPVPEGYHDPEHRWYACFLSPEIIFYNREMVDSAEAPTDWADLAHPRWKDRILMRFPLPSDTMRAIFFGIIDRSIKQSGDEENAFEWMSGVDAGTKDYLSGGEQVFRKMAQRVGAVSLWTLSDIMLQKTRYGYPFEIVYPKSGSPVILDGIAVIKNAAHPKAARAYYEFVTSKESAVKLANAPYYRIPTRNDLDTSRLPEWMRSPGYTPQELDWNLYLEKMNGWMARWDKEIKNQGKYPGGEKQ